MEIIILLLLLLLFLMYVFRDKEVKTEVLNNGDGLNKFGYDKDIVHEFPGFLSDEECEYIINLGRPRVRKSKVICEGGVHCNNNKSRTSSNSFIGDEEDPIVSNISKRISDKVGIGLSNFENLQVVHYKGGEQYKPHWDACVGEGRCDEFVKNGGDRYATFLLYLNDDFDEGETEFPRRGIKVKPEKGKGVLFYNLDDDNITYKKSSMHAGLPPTNGEKWMCNKWIRVGKYDNNMNKH